MDKLGVLRPLSLPPVGDGGGWALDMKGKRERVWEKTKGIGGQKGSVMVSILIKLKYEAVINIMMQVT